MQLIKRPKNYNYGELHTSSGSKFDYPETCPCCEANGAEVKDSWYHKFAYECGGKWEWKSQIQNHTNKVYGRCGLDDKYEEQERVAMFAIFYSSFCNWSIFSSIEGVNSVKENVLHKMKERWSAPNDYRKEYRNWVEENYEKYIEQVKELCNHHRHVDPRLICGFDEDENAVYVTDWKEISERLNEIGFNEYGSLQFHKSGSMGKSLTTWWKNSVVESV